MASRGRSLLFAGVAAVVVMGCGLQIMRLLRGSPQPEVVDLSSVQTPQPSQNSSADTKPRSEATPVANPLDKPREAASLSGAFSHEPMDVASVSHFTPPSVEPAPSDPTPVGSINAKADPVQGTSLLDAATAGNGAAQYELASRYADGRTIARNPQLAAQWFEKAAAQDVVPAQYRLGTIYERGTGVSRDLKRARDWYQRAAEKGNVRAMHNLAVLSAEGVDGKPDYATASRWFRKAAEFGVRDSQYNLGILYARGLGIEQNLPLSWAWFSLAAAQGDEDAAKKRDDVGAKLDSNQRAEGKAFVAKFVQRTPDQASNDVGTPPGGWDVPVGAEHRQSPAPAPAATRGTKPAVKGKISSL